ncbi:MAG: hypothetical protein WCI46_15880, partial [Verrucomicrobiota bacterium]
MDVCRLAENGRSARSGKTGASLGNFCWREAHRSRFKAECISKIGDGLEGLNETVYWLELLTVFRIVSSPRQTSLQDETNQPLVILTMRCAFYLGVLGARRFSGRKWVRAKDAKVRKAVAGLPIDYTGWRAFGWRGLPGSVSPTT